MATEAGRTRRNVRAKLLRILRWQSIQVHLHGIADHQTIQDGREYDMPGDGNIPLLLSQVYEVLPERDGDEFVANLNRFDIAGKWHIGIEDVRVRQDR